MEEKRAKIGFVGCGGFSTGALYPTIHTIPEFDLVAVCDLKEELAKRNARNFGARRWYTDLDKMFSEEKLDGVVVVGVPKMHYEVGKRCLDKGLPIYVEKPSANTYKEALELAEYAKKKGLFGAIGFMKRQSAYYKMAKEITAREEFGGISEVAVHFSNGPYPALWGIKEDTKSMLIGQLVHIFDLVRFFCGEVDEVYARLNKVDTGCFGYAVTVVFKSGAVGVMNLNSLNYANPPDWKVSEYLSISGRGCWLEVKDMASLCYHSKTELNRELNPKHRVQTITWQPELTELIASKDDGMFGYSGELQNFARATLGLEKPSADLFDGAKALRIAEAIWESSQSKKVVKI